MEPQKLGGISGGGGGGGSGVSGGMVVVIGRSWIWWLRKLVVCGDENVVLKGGPDGGGIHQPRFGFGTVRVRVGGLTFLVGPPTKSW